MRFGLTGLIVRESSSGIRIITKQKVCGGKQTWTKCLTFNFNPGSKGILSGKRSMHDYLQAEYKEKRVVIIEVEGFVSNGTSTIAKELYPGYDRYFVVFQKVGYSLRLLTLGSKTLAEFRAAGHDTFLKSRVPLLLTIIANSKGQQQYVSVNLKTFIKPKEHHNGQGTRRNKDDERDG